MTHPTNTTNKNAKVGFCSLMMSDKNVPIKPNPTICMISMAHPPFTLERGIQILSSGISPLQWMPQEIKYI